MGLLLRPFSTLRLGAEPVKRRVKRSRQSQEKWVTVNDLYAEGLSVRADRSGRSQLRSGYKPELTPAEMLALGVFCGKYMTDCRQGIPRELVQESEAGAKGRDCSLNYFGVDASQPLSEWRFKGWLHDDDPRGWFQWYCRYYMGRRMPEEDRRQIKRWKAFRRHVNQIKMNCEPGDPFCRPRQRQALLHWAYDSRKI